MSGLNGAGLRRAGRCLRELPLGWQLFLASLLISWLLFGRPPHSNFVFDEQEAILANPFLQGRADEDLFAALRVDFWGRDPAHTIGAYRPLPNLLWRALWFARSERSPWGYWLVNPVVHAASSAALGMLLLRLFSSAELGRPSSARGAAWFGCLFFSSAALMTEAVCSVVGLADLLVGLFTVVSVHLMVSLQSGAGWRVKAAYLLALILVQTLACFSKESALASQLFLIVLAGAAAIGRGSALLARLGAFAMVLLAVACAQASYVATRLHFYPTKVASIETHVSPGPLSEAVALLFGWLSPPVMPSDPMNNPLFQSGLSERAATACTTFLSQVVALFFPLHLVGDYSFPRLVPQSWGAAAVFGALLWFALLFASAYGLARRPNGCPGARRWLACCGALWLSITSFVLSGALVALPTVRADRLFYLPAMGAALLASLAFTQLWEHRPVARRWLVVAFSFQAIQARAHALHYTDDVVFWRAAAHGAPASAKAHLNYGLMLGARGQLHERLDATQRALALAPNWPLGNIYLADAYCRLDDLVAAWPHYQRGLAQAPNRKALVALSLQCLWDRRAYDTYQSRLQQMAQGHPGSWLSYLHQRVVDEGESNQGVPPEYRPRPYNRSTASPGSQKAR